MAVLRKPGRSLSESRGLVTSAWAWVARRIPLALNERRIALTRRVYLVTHNGRGGGCDGEKALGPQ
jgi:hypothetical protein